MTKLKLISSAVAFVAFSAASLASAGSPADYFEKMDADASGTVTQAEYVAYKTAGGKYSATKAGEKFAMLAGDDGQMTLAELESSMAKANAKKNCDKSKETAA